MQTNTTQQQYFGGDLQLTAPHFDEEATVLSAQPVVPLQEIHQARGRTLSKRHLAFGLSIVASLMIGALGATLIYKQRNQVPAAVIVSEAIPGSGTMTPYSGLSATGKAEGDVAQEETKNIDPPANKKPAPQIATSVARVVERKAVAPKVSPVKSATKPEPIQVDDWATRRAERIEARRQRRAERDDEPNQGRGHRRRSAEDLLKIREIFEGPGKP